MNERAGRRRPDSLWHVDSGWSLFAGALGHNAPHAHSAAVHIAGLYEPLRLRIGNGAWRSCRAAVIRAGTPYEFDAAGSPLGVLYLEPDAGTPELLAGLISDGEECDGALVGRHDATHVRALFEARAGAADVSDAVDDLLSFLQQRTRRTIDARVARAIDLLHREESLLSAAGLAATVSLSPSRFQHLFTAEVGVPFRRYRGWLRLRRAIRIAAGGKSLTHAAHAAGFADQAHFSRLFRSTFGAPPSRGL